MILTAIADSGKSLKALWKTSIAIESDYKGHIVEQIIAYIVSWDI